MRRSLPTRYCNLRADGNVFFGPSLLQRKVVGPLVIASLPKHSITDGDETDTGYKRVQEPASRLRRDVM